MKRFSIHLTLLLILWICSVLFTFTIPAAANNPPETLQQRLDLEKREETPRIKKRLTRREYRRLHKADTHFPESSDDESDGAQKTRPTRTRRKHNTRGSPQRAKVVGVIEKPSQYILSGMQNDIQRADKTDVYRNVADRIIALNKRNEVLDRFYPKMVTPRSYTPGPASFDGQKKVSSVWTETHPYREDPSPVPVEQAKEDVQRIFNELKRLHGKSESVPSTPPTNGLVPQPPTPVNAAKSLVSVAHPTYINGKAIASSASVKSRVPNKPLSHVATSEKRAAQLLNDQPRDGHIERKSPSVPDVSSKSGSPSGSISGSLATYEVLDANLNNAREPRGQTYVQDNALYDYAKLSNDLGETTDDYAEVYSGPGSTGNRKRSRATKPSRPKAVNKWVTPDAIYDIPTLPSDAPASHDPPSHAPPSHAPPSHAPPSHAPPSSRFKRLFGFFFKKARKDSSSKPFRNSKTSKKNVSLDDVIFHDNPLYVPKPPPVQKGLGKTSSGVKQFFKRINPFKACVN